MTSAQTMPDDLAVILADEAACKLDGMFRDIFNQEERHDLIRAILVAAKSRSFDTSVQDPLAVLEDNCWDMRCFDIPTGGGDADIGWSVIEHHMAPPKERVVGTGRSPREALQDAAVALTRPQREAPPIEENETKNEYVKDDGQFGVGS